MYLAQNKYKQRNTKIRVQLDKMETCNTLQALVKPTGMYLNESLLMSF